MAKDKKTAKKIAKKVAEILSDSKLAKETHAQRQNKPNWETVKAAAPNKIRPSKKRG